MMKILSLFLILNLISIGTAYADYLQYCKKDKECTGQGTTVCCPSDHHCHFKGNCPSFTPQSIMKQSIPKQTVTRQHGSWEPDEPQMTMPPGMMPPMPSK